MVKTLTLNQAERRELISAMVENCAGWDKEDLDIIVNMSDSKLWTHAQGCAQLIANQEIEDAGDLPDSLEPESAEAEKAAAEGADDDQVVEGEEGEAGVTRPNPMRRNTNRRNAGTRRVTKWTVETTPQAGENVQNEQAYIANLPPRVRSVVIRAIVMIRLAKSELGAGS